MASRLKNFGLFLVLLAAAAYGIYRGEQTFATVALLLLVAVTYKHLVRPFVSRAAEFAGRVDYAKFRDLEVRAAEQGAELARLEGLQLTVLQDVILRNLDPQLCGVLANLGTYDKAPIKSAHLDRLRELRDRGLIQHDGPRLGQSNEVWLTPLGKEVAELLTRPSAEAERQVTNQQVDQVDHQV